MSLHMCGFLWNPSGLQVLSRGQSRAVLLQKTQGPLPPASTRLARGRINSTKVRRVRSKRKHRASSSHRANIRRSPSRLTPIGVHARGIDRQGTRKRALVSISIQHAYPCDSLFGVEAPQQAENAAGCWGTPRSNRAQLLLTQAPRVDLRRVDTTDSTASTSCEYQGMHGVDM